MVLQIFGLCAKKYFYIWELYEKGQKEENTENLVSRDFSNMFKLFLSLLGGGIVG